MTCVHSLVARLQWPKPADQRAARCTGVAMSIAVSLLQKALGWQGGRIMVLTGGPPTVGPGMIVGRPLTEPIRSHTDLQKDKAPYHKAATAFYKVRSRWPCRTVSGRDLHGFPCFFALFFLPSFLPHPKYGFTAVFSR